MRLEDIRQLFVDVALSMVGLGADPKDPDRRRAFIELVAPGESASQQQALITKSTCGFIAAAVWRAAGVVHDILVEPYVDQTAISRLHVIAPAAWIPYAAGRLPQRGDTVLIGDNTLAGGVEHVYVVTDVEEGDVPILHSVDGGQRDAKRFQEVHAKSHAWRHGRDFSYEGTDPGANTTNGRRIIGWFDAVLLSALIPESNNTENDDQPDYREVT